MRPLAALVLLALLALSPAAQADTARIALVSLCDPAKIATLTSDRAATPRVRKITYWLEVARQQAVIRRPRWTPSWTLVAGAER